MSERGLLFQISVFDDGNVAYRGATKEDVPRVLRMLADSFDPVVEIVDPKALLRDHPDDPDGLTS